MQPQQLVLEDLDQERFLVHRSAMTSQDIFRAELEVIFGTGWLYAGHISEVSQPGDFVRRKVGGRPLFLVRGARSGEVNVFHNSCTHRGATVCRQDTGNAKVFQCFYHAWTFSSEGALTGVPDAAAYGKGFSKEALGLKRPARTETYRGFVFVSFDEEVVDLVTYLAGARDYLDLIVDGAESELEVVPGSNQYSIDANWKLLVENSIDGYHAATTHDTYFKYLANMGTDLSTGVDGFSYALGNGHAVMEYRGPWGRPIAKWEKLYGEDAKADIDARRGRLVARYGEERATRMADHNRNLFIFPNLIVNDIMALTVRTFMPSSPDHMEITAWQLGPSDEHDVVRARRLDSFLTFLGPGGFATPDDVEALESCQEGFSSGGVEWNDISRGMNREPLAKDEEQMRAFWRQWNQRMTSARLQGGAAR